MKKIFIDGELVSVCLPVCWFLFVDGNANAYTCVSVSIRILSQHSVASSS